MTTQKYSSCICGQMSNEKCLQVGLSRLQIIKQFSEIASTANSRIHKSCAEIFRISKVPRILNQKHFTEDVFKEIFKRVQTIIEKIPLAETRGLSLERVNAAIEKEFVFFCPTKMSKQRIKTMITCYIDGKQPGVSSDLKKHQEIRDTFQYFAGQPSDTHVENFLLIVQTLVSIVQNTVIESDRLIIVKELLNGMEPAVNQDAHFDEPVSSVL